MKKKNQTDGLQTDHPNTIFTKMWNRQHLTLACELIHKIQEDGGKANMMYENKAVSLHQISTLKKENINN